MLLDEESELRIAETVSAIASSYAIFALGKELGRTTTQQARAVFGATSTRLTFLEQSYLAGKAASVVGTDALRNMSAERLQNWLQTNNINLTDVDQATLTGLKQETERWLQGRSETWQQKMRVQIGIQDREWRATLSGRTFRNAQSIAVARNAALNNLIDRLRDEGAGMQSDADRLIQSEMHNYFQKGQTADRPKDEIVYKVPRLSACRECLRICVNPDGSPKKFKLSDVEGLSNFGLPKFAWEFVIGPIHPYCYCILFRETDKKAFDKNTRAAKDRSKERAERLSKSTRSDPIGDGQIKDLVKGLGPDLAEQPHLIAFLSAVRKIYADSLPLD